VTREKAVILECAILDVKPGETAAFEAAFAEARAIIAASEGCLSYELRRCVEKSDRYLLLVRWRSLEDHTQGFRGSAAYQEWRRLLHHFYDPFPMVEHYEALGRPFAAVPVVEFFFSPASRYSYLAASQIAAVEADTGCRVDWRPVHGPRIRALRGADPFAGAPISGQYDWRYRRRDAEAWADAYGIRFREPPTHVFDFERAATAARRLGRAADYGWAITREIYGTDVWPVDEDACARVAEEVGIDRAAFRAALADPATAKDLDDTAVEAHRRGVFGVPTFFVGDELYWGNDRLALVRRAVLRHRG
jgi:2-hydroxychromene-2-carboxylate isomerase/heme-degrading monooxygenase HmoA